MLYLKTTLSIRKVAHAKLVGNLTTKCSNSSILSFTLLKSFDINIHPSKPLRCIDVLWSPPPFGWVKCNVDGLAKGSPMLIACRGIFKNDQACHVGSLCDFFDVGSSEMAELLAALAATEKARELNWKKLQIETDYLLVVKAFSNSNLVSWKIKSRWLNGRAYTLNIDFMITHIYREVKFFVLIFLQTFVFKPRNSLDFLIVVLLLVRQGRYH